jgi:small-conductance mechanosensitive channel
MIKSLKEIKMHTRAKVHWFYLAIMIAMSFLISFANAAQSTPAPEIKPETLTVMNRDLAVFRAGFNGATPAVRVDNALKRIRQIERIELSEDIRAIPFTLGNEKGFQFQLGTRHLFSLTEKDLDAESNQQMKGLVEHTVKILEELKTARYQQGKLSFLIHEGVLVLLATIALLVSIYFVRRVLNWVGHFLLMKCRDISARTDGTHWSEYFFLFGARLTQIISWLVMLLLLYAWITFSFSRFPLTYPLGHKLGVHVTDTLHWIVQSILTAIPNLITIFIVVFITRSILDLLKVFFRRVQGGQLKIPFLHFETVSATQRITTVVIWGLCLAIIYPFIPGSSSEAFKGLSVLLGIIISLGSTGLVTQLMSGLVVVYSRALRVGDFVQVNGVKGVVTEIGGLATKVQTQNKIETTIPNSVIISNSIENFTRLNDATGTLLSTTVTIGYDAPWRKVHEMLIKAALATNQIQSIPSPYVYQRALSDFYVEYQLFMHTEFPDIQIKILSELHQKIQDEFNQAGIQIMSPHFNTQPNHPVLSPTKLS